MSIAPLLVELFTEELPPRALRALGESFADGIALGLVKAQLLVGDASERHAFASPRRLAVLLPRVRPHGDERAELRKLMPVKVALDAQGNPTEALRKRLEKEGVDPATARIETRREGSADFVFLHRVEPGAFLSTALQSALDATLGALPVPKLMSYQLADGATTVHFARPAHGLVALHGGDVVPVKALGLSSGRVTRGHRFQGEHSISLEQAQDYERTLEGPGAVIPDFSRRRDEILRMLREHAGEVGGDLGPDSEVAPLLEEVTALVERPAVYVGEFDPEFLAVPQECLILTMRQNQKYFPLFNGDGKLTHRFLIVSNMRLDNARNIIDGNQRVVRPRLADARFFFETDLKASLESRVPRLAAIVYHNKLGTQLGRVERLETLAGSIAARLGGDEVLARRAARLAKADLLSGMVGEFPELQGVMGRYYALHDGEPAEVANAIAAHYLPRFAGDALPEGTVACAVALADRLLTLAGLFGIGQTPSGDKDPFGLRRASLGVIRILIERQLDLDLRDLIGSALNAFDDRMPTAEDALSGFIVERLRGYLADQGGSVAEIDALLALRPGVLAAIPDQMRAVRAFGEMPESASLAAANKRIVNILKGADTSGASADALIDPAERSLFDAMHKAGSRAGACWARQDYSGYLAALAPLKQPVDEFFDKVMVMADDPAVRANRLALLGDLRRLMNRFVDLSRLAAG